MTHRRLPDDPVTTATGRLPEYENGDARSNQ